MNDPEWNEGALEFATVLGTQSPTVGEMAILSCARGQQIQSVQETILFVEDEVFVREVAGEILCSAGYRVLRAKSSEQARSVYEQCGEEIDLLLTDIVLPGENGKTLAGKLRMENPEIKVLFITGYVEQIGKFRMEGDRESCLAKPFSAQALLQRVRYVLDEKTNRNGNAFRHAAGSG